MVLKLTNEIKNLQFYQRNIISESKIIWLIMFVLFVFFRPSLLIDLSFSYVLLYSFTFTCCFTITYVCTNFLLFKGAEQVKLNCNNIIASNSIYLLVFIALTFFLVLISLIILNYFFSNSNNLITATTLNNTILLILSEVAKLVVFFHFFVCLILIHGAKKIKREKENLRVDYRQLSSPTFIDVKKNMNEVKAKKKINTLEKDLVIKGLNKNEIITINTNALIYVKSEGHYSKVYYFEAFKNREIIKFSLIRNSIKNIEKIVTEVSPIVRTHKSYIVNLLHINYVRCNMRNGLMSVNKANVKLPIGKTYIQLLVDHINNTHPEVRLFN
jgi:hypothetical protein